ncbi:unnamed protein product [Ectocarpus fasciculatus]
MQPNPSPIPIDVGDGCGQASYEMFWDGDPSKQSFISVVGLSSPRASPPRPRPLSAPARGAHLSRFHSPRQSQWSVGGFEVGREQTIRSSSKQNAYEARERSTPRAAHKGENSLGVERVPVLERIWENTSMRDANLSIGDRKRLERLGQAQRRNLELIAALQTAKARAEKKAKRAQDKVNTLQNELRNQGTQQQTATPTQQCSPTWGDRLDGSLASASRPKSAPLQRRPSRKGQPATDTASALATAGERHSAQTASVGDRCTTVAGTTPTRDGWVGAARRIAGKRETGDHVESSGIAGAGEEKRFLAVRPKPDAKPSWQKGGTTCNRSTFSPCAAASGNLKSSTLGGGAVADREGAESAEAALAGRLGGKEDNAAGERLEGTKSIPKECINSAARDGCAHRRGGGGGRGGETRGGHVESSSLHDTAPKVLLARETEAALRRAQRVAAVKEKEEEELRLSSSFRAKELHATNGPDWATIKAHQDLVRKQRTRDRAAFLAATSSLPARMARHAAMQAVEEDRASSNVRSGSRDKRGDDDGRGLVGGGTGTVDPGDIGRVMQRRQERRVFEHPSLAAAKASSRVAVTRPLTPPMEKRRLAQEAKRRAKEKADQSARETAANQRAQDERRQFQQLVEMHRATGSTFRETKTSVRKAQEARQKKIEDLEHEERERAVVLAEEARRREVSRAVREYVVASEARRREEHGAGPPLEELVQRKKARNASTKKQAEFRERWRLNRSGLRQALRKRPNLLERQEKFAQQHSKRVADQAATARDFLESTEGFAAAGRRALPGGGKGWMEKAAADNTFSSKEKADLGLPVLVGDGDDTKRASADGIITVADQDFVFAGADKEAGDSPGGDSSGGDHERPSGLREARGDGESEVAAEEEATLAEDDEMTSSSGLASSRAGGSSAAASAQARDGAQHQEGVPTPGRGAKEESQGKGTSAETKEGSVDGSAGSENTS